MNIRTGLLAGMSFDQCADLREWWKDMARSGKCVANPSPPGTTVPPTTTKPPTTTTTIQPACYGGFVNGVYFPDMSGTCGYS